MLDSSGDDVPLGRLSLQCGPDGGIVTFRGTGGEDDFLRMAVQHVGHLLAAFIHIFGDLAAEGMHAGGVAPVFLEEGNHSLGDFRGDHGGRVIVEINGFHYF